jgi:hypothetical protein
MRESVCPCWHVCEFVLYCWFVCKCPPGCVGIFVRFFCVCMFVCVFTSVWMYEYMHVRSYVHVWVCLCTHVWVWVYISVQVCMHICVYICMPAYKTGLECMRVNVMCICMCICVRICAHICAHVSVCACIFWGMQVCVGVFKPPDCEHLIYVVMYVLMSYNIIMWLGKHAL